MPSPLVKIALITSAHGIKGHVKIKTFTQLPESVCAYGDLTDDKGACYTLSLMRVVSTDSVIARIVGVDDRNRAEELRGVTLYMDRAKLPKAQDDEYYHTDLIGLAVRTEAGDNLGTIQGVHNFGAGDILDVKIIGGRSVFVLFDRENVPVVDISGGFVVVRSLPKAQDEADAAETGNDTPSSKKV